MTRSSLSRRRPPELLILAFATFVAIGLSNGLLGVAWPSMRDTFGLPLDAIAPLLASTTVGFVLGSVTSGQLSARFGLRPFLLLNNLLAADHSIRAPVLPA